MARISSLVSLLSLVSVLASAAGCGGPPASGPALQFDPCAPLAIVADPGATEGQQAAITAAVALWNEMVHSHLALAGTPGPLDDGGAAVPIHFQRAGPPFYGLYDPGTGQLFINEALAGEGQIVTIAHEVGHAFGLEHVPADQRPSVMNPGNLIHEPTSADRDTLAIGWGYCH